MKNLSDTALVKKMGGGAQTAEEHRDSREHSGFIGSIGKGKADFNRLFHPWYEVPQFETDSLSNYLLKLKTFCERVPRAVREGRVDMSLDLIQKMGEMGLFCLKVPKEPWGGMGFSHSSYIEILSFLTTHFPAALIMLSAHNTIGGLYPVLYYGNEEQQKEWMPILTKWPSAFCFTEDKVGSDPARMESHATVTRNEKGEIIKYNLSGIKYYATNSAYADGVPLAKLLAVIARVVNNPEVEISRWSRLDPKERRKAKKEEAKKIENSIPKDAHDRANLIKEYEYNAGLRARYGCFIIPSDTPGFEVVQRTEFEGMEGIFNGILKFDNVELTSHNRIKGDGFKIALESLTNGRLAIAKGCLAAAKRDIAGMTWYAKGREQWEQAIIDKEMIGSGMISPAIADVFACEALAKYTAARADNKMDIRLEATIVKIAAARIQHRTVRDLNTIVGGRAFEKWQSLSRREECVPSFLWMRNSWPCETFEGSKQILTIWSERELDNDFILNGLEFKTGGWWSKLKVGTRMMKQYIYHLIASHMPGNDYVNYIKKTAHRLRKTKIMLYGIHKESLLERKQLMQGRLVNIVTDLALMALSLQYAEHMNNDDYRQLADYFCKEAKLRIEQNFTEIKYNNDDLAGKILDKHKSGAFDKFLTDNLAPMDWLLVRKHSAEEAKDELESAKLFKMSSCGCSKGGCKNKTKSYTGIVEKRIFGDGTKSEHPAVVLKYGDTYLKLRLPNSNPFNDPELDKFVGRNMFIEGVVHSGQLLMAKWQFVDDKEEIVKTDQGTPSKFIRSDDYLNEVKSQLSRRFLVPGGAIHGISVKHNDKTICVYTDASITEKLIETVRDAAKPFTITVIKQERASIQ